jgi:AraC-like DNA-binding protein
LSLEITGGVQVETAHVKSLIASAKPVINKFTLSNAAQRPRDRFEFWRSAFSQDAEIFDDGFGDAPPSTATFHVLGNLGFGVFSGAGYNSNRDLRHTKRAASENLMIFRRDCRRTDVTLPNDRHFTVCRGQPFVQNDLQPVRFNFTPGGPQNYSALAIKWDDVRAEMTGRNRGMISSRPLYGFRAALVTAWMESLGEHGLDLPEIDTRHLVTSTAQILAAVFDGQFDQPGHRVKAVNAARLAMARSFIELRVHDPDLDPMMVAAYCRCSLRTIHSLFEAYGSIMTYVRDRRLERVRERLLAPGETRLKLSDLSRHYGFGSPAYFSHLFRQKFDMTPSEMLYEQGLIR